MGMLLIFSCVTGGLGSFTLGLELGSLFESGPYLGLLLGITCGSRESLGCWIIGSGLSRSSGGRSGGSAGSSFLCGSGSLGGSYLSLFLGKDACLFLLRGLGFGLIGEIIELLDEF